MHRPFGCCQLALTLTLVLSFSSLGQISYSFAYFQDVGHLQINCRPSPSSEWRPCSAAEVCEGGLPYSIDIESPHSIRNWIYDFELLCPAARHELTWLATSYFLCFLLSSVISMQVADCVGRKPIILVGLLLHASINIFLLL